MTAEQSDSTEPLVFYYRIEDGANQHSQPFLRIYHLVRKTPNGAWIVYGEYPRAPLLKTIKPLLSVDLRAMGARYVKDDARRSYAYPTMEAALNSYRIRKHKQIQHCQRAIEKATNSLKLLSEATITETSITYANEPPACPIFIR